MGSGTDLTLTIPKDAMNNTLTLPPETLRAAALDSQYRRVLTVHGEADGLAVTSTELELFDHDSPVYLTVDPATISEDDEETTIKVTATREGKQCADGNSVGQQSADILLSFSGLAAAGTDYRITLSAPTRDHRRGSELWTRDVANRSNR